MAWVRLDMEGVHPLPPPTYEGWSLLVVCTVGRLGKGSMEAHYYCLTLCSRHGHVPLVAVIPSTQQLDVSSTATCHAPVVVLVVSMHYS